MRLQRNNHPITPHGQKTAEYGLIASFKSKDKDTLYGKFRHFIYFGTKYILYAISCNKPKAAKYKSRLTALLHADRHYTLLGHISLLSSLFRGFDELGIPYTYNEITKSTKNIVLLWCDRRDLKRVRKLKKHGRINKVVTVPTACKFDYDLQYIFPEYDCIDRVLCASEVTKQKNFVPRVKPEFIDKVIAWPSGVILPEKPRNKIYNTCVCYYKRLTPDPKLRKKLEDMGIKCIDLVYGSYAISDWYNHLAKVDFVIFIQDITETQGLAMAEAWAHNRPTFIKTSDKTGLNRTSPYLTDQCGAIFTDTNELDNILAQYHASPSDFLKQFHPYEYVKQNMSDRVSVQKLIDIFDGIDNNTQPVHTV